MKKRFRPIIVIGFSILIALLFSAVTYTVRLDGHEGSLSAAALFLQTTPPPQEVDRSEVGSTDGIVIMGFVIVAIVVIPILLRRKAWMNTQ